MIIVVPSCLKDADGARTRSDQKLLITEKELVVALGICYRQLICSRIFCRSVTPYLFDKGSLDDFQLYELFTRTLPSYVQILI